MFSVCVIMKNEQKNLEAFLNSLEVLKCFCDFELILVDTGSEDASVEIAERKGYRVNSFTWVNDFSAARNYSLSLATNDWILVLDCDEYLESFSAEAMEALMQKPESVGLITRKNVFTVDGNQSSYTDLVGRFFHKKYYHYEAPIHEQLCKADGSMDYQRVDMGLVVSHNGYNGTGEELRKKATRNNDLLLSMLENTPDDPYLLFQIGQSYRVLKDDEKASYYFGKGLEQDVDPDLHYVHLMVIGYGYSLLNLGRLEEALGFQGIYDTFCGSGDFLCLMGLIYLRCGMVEAAMGEFTKAAKCQKVYTEGANTVIPKYNLGCIHEVLGNRQTAIAYYQECGEFEPAKKRLELM